MKSDFFVRSASKIILIFIISFAFYIQLNGESSPGGGFQSGMILTSGVVLYELVYGNIQKFLNDNLVDSLITLGVSIYGFVGLLCMVRGGEFLNYNYLLNDCVKAQKLGISLVEFGVGITVFAVGVKIFYHFLRGLNGNNY